MLYVNWNYLKEPIPQGTEPDDDYKIIQLNPIINLTNLTHQMIYLGQGGLNLLHNIKACSDSTPFKIISTENVVTVLDSWRMIEIESPSEVDSLSTTDTDSDTPTAVASLHTTLVNALYLFSTPGDNDDEKIKQNKTVQNFLNRYNHDVVCKSVFAYFNKNLHALTNGNATLDTFSLKQKIKIDKKGNIVVEVKVSDLRITQMNAKGEYESHELKGSFTFTGVQEQVDTAVSISSENHELVRLFEGRMTVAEFKEVCPTLNIPDKENKIDNLKILSQRIALNDESLAHVSYNLLKIIFPEINDLPRRTSLNDFLKAIIKTYSGEPNFNANQKKVIDFLCGYTKNPTGELAQGLFETVVSKKTINDHEFFTTTQCQHLRVLLGLPVFKPKVVGDFKTAALGGRKPPKTEDNIYSLLIDALSRHSTFYHPHANQLIESIFNFVISEKMPEDEQELISAINNIINQTIPELDEPVKVLLPIASREFFDHIFDTSKLIYSWDHFKSRIGHFFRSCANSIVDAITFPFSLDRVSVKFSNFIAYFRKNSQMVTLSDDVLERPNILINDEENPELLTIENLARTEIQRFRLNTEQKQKVYLSAYNGEQEALYYEQTALYFEQALPRVEALAKDAAEKTSNIFYYLFMSYDDHVKLSHKAQELSLKVDTIRGYANEFRMAADNARQEANSFAVKAGLRSPAKQVRDERDLCTVDKVFNYYYTTQEIQKITRTLNDISRSNESRTNTLYSVDALHKLSVLVEQGNKFAVLQFLEMEAFKAEKSELNSVTVASNCQLTAEKFHLKATQSKSQSQAEVLNARVAQLNSKAETLKLKARQLRNIADQFKNSELFIETDGVSDTNSTSTTLKYDAAQQKTVCFPPENAIASVYTESTEKDDEKIVHATDSLFLLKEAIVKARDELGFLKNEISDLLKEKHTLIERPLYISNNAIFGNAKTNKDQLPVAQQKIEEKTTAKTTLIKEKTDALFLQAQAAKINITKMQLTLLINHHTTLSVDEYIERNNSETSTTKTALPLYADNKLKPVIKMSKGDLYVNNQPLQC